MNHLETGRPGAHFAIATQARAANHALLLRAREVEKTQGNDTGAIREAAQQRAAPAERDLSELDRAFDERLLARDQAAERPNRRSVLVALRQQAEQVRDSLDAEPSEARGYDRTHAGQVSGRLPERRLLDSAAC